MMLFEELVMKINPKLKGIAHRLNGRHTFFNDEDLYQEAVIHLWVDFNNNKLQDKTESYILQGCYFHLKNYIRKAQNKRTIVSLDAFVREDGPEFEDFLPASDPEDFFEALNNKFMVEKMQNNGLTSREKDVLAFFLEGLTCRQIGQKMGISHVSVLKLKNRIKNRYERFFFK